MKNLHCEKAKSYGSNEDPLANLRSGERFGVPASIRCLVEAESAFYRTVNYCNGRNPSWESLENALMDASAFSLLALRFFREEREKRHAEVADAQFEYEEALSECKKMGVNTLDSETIRSVLVNGTTGYRPPSEEIGNKMTEVLEKAK